MSREYFVPIARDKEGRLFIGGVFSSSAAAEMSLDEMDPDYDSDHPVNSGIICSFSLDRTNKTPIFQPPTINPKRHA